MLNALIKSDPDSLPIWQQPPPSSIRLPELPPKDPTLHITPNEYDFKLQHHPEEFMKPGKNDQKVKRVILHEIEKLPALWKDPNSHNRQKFYPSVAMKVYLRTGKLIAPATIQAVFKRARATLRNRLVRAIQVKKLNPRETENYLWESDMYSSIRFHRFVTQSWEKKARTQLMFDPNGDPIVFDVEDDEVDNGIYDSGFTENSFEDVVEMVDPTDIHQDYGRSMVEESFNRTQVKSDPVYHDHVPVNPQPSTNHTENHPTPQKHQPHQFHHQEQQQFYPNPIMNLQGTEPTIETLFFIQKMNKISREQPEMANLVDSAFMSTLVAVNEGIHFNDLGELFTHLARRFSRK